MDVNPAVYNFPASGGGGMRCNQREVAFPSTSREAAPLIKEIQIDVDKGNPLI
jgi:hypothetical protein